MQTVGHSDRCPTEPETRYSVNERKEGSGCHHRGRLKTIRVLFQWAVLDAPRPGASRRGWGTLGVASEAARGTLSAWGSTGGVRPPPNPTCPFLNEGS